MVCCVMDEGAGASAHLAGQIIIADFEREIGSGKRAGRPDYIDHDAVDALVIGSEIGESGGLAGKKGDLVRGDSVVVGGPGEGRALVE